MHNVTVCFRSYEYWSFVSPWQTNTQVAHIRLIVTKLKMSATNKKRLLDDVHEKLTPISLGPTGPSSSILNRACCRERTRRAGKELLAPSFCARPVPSRLSRGPFCRSRR